MCHRIFLAYTYRAMLGYYSVSGLPMLFLCINVPLGFTYNEEKLCKININITIIFHIHYIEIIISISRISYMEENGCLKILL